MFTFYASCPDDQPCDLGAGDLAWLPIVGPSVTVLVQLIAREDSDRLGFSLEEETLVDWTGLKPVALRRTIERMIRFGLAARIQGDTYLVSCRVQYPNERQYLKASEARWPQARTSVGIGQPGEQRDPIPPGVINAPGGPAYGEAP